LKKTLLFTYTYKNGEKMTPGNVLVNDTVRIKVKFIDTDSATGEQQNVEPVSVFVNITNSSDQSVTNASASSLSASEYFYDFTPALADEYEIIFTGVLDDNTQITVKQVLYVSDSSATYRPSVTLRSDETIVFSADVFPLFIDPEEILAYFPDASLLEAGELIHHYSLEIRYIFNMNEDDNGSDLNFIVQEYIKASVCCELSRTYGFGGDDELSLKLADLSITNRSQPRNSVNRGNATTWCQIAAALRKEMLASRVGPTAIRPKGLPGITLGTAGATVDPATGQLTYLSDRDLYGREKKVTSKEDPMPKRGLRKYD
jgi:hypothetical protein